VSSAITGTGDVTLKNVATGGPIVASFAHTGNLTFASDSTGTGSVSTASAANTGAIINNSAGTGSWTINAFGSAVTSITQNSATSPFTIKAETFTGNIIVNAGTLGISFNSNTGNNTANILTLGGGKFSTSSKPATLSSQTFTGGTTLNGGASAVFVSRSDPVPVGTSGMALNLGAITRNGTGSTVLVNYPVITLQPLSAINGLLTSTGSASTTLLDNGVAYAYSGGSWVAKDSTNTWLVNAGTNVNTASTLGSLSTTTGVVDTILVANATTVTMKSALTSARTITATGFTITTGGILLGDTVTTGNGLTITGGTLKSAATIAGKDLVIINNSGTAGALSISSVIADATAGSTGLTYTGTAGGVTTLSGNNTFTGNTRINSGNLTLASNLALQNSAVDTAGAGAITLSGITAPTLGGLIGSKDLASVITSGASGVTSLTLNPSAGSVTYSGVIANLGSGAMSIEKTGAGKQILTAANTYTGTTTVSVGTLLVNNTTGNGTGTGSLSVSSGAILGGSGTIAGAVSVAGTLAPGNSPANLTVNNSVAILDGGTLSMEIAGAVFASGYDRLTMTGAGSVFSLAGTNNLALSLTYSPANNALFFLVDNQGGSDLSGVFEKLNGETKDLTNGATFRVSGQDFKISYFGDVGAGSFTGGDDLVIQAVPEPATWLLLAATGTFFMVMRRRRM
jgi:autotransporter-associated beta strand protein